MTRPPSIPADLWDDIPPNLRPAIAAVVIGMENRIADLDARRGQTSANSSLPPSADPPHAKPAPPRAPTGKRKGGPPGHPKAERPVLPPMAAEQVVLGWLAAYAPAVETGDLAAVFTIASECGFRELPRDRVRGVWAKSRARWTALVMRTRGRTA